MTKKVGFNELSDTHCIDCNKLLKKNLVLRNPKAKRCNVCYILSTSNLNINRAKLKAKQDANKLSFNKQ